MGKRVSSRGIDFYVILSSDAKAFNGGLGGVAFLTSDLWLLNRSNFSEFMLQPTVKKSWLGNHGLKPCNVTSILKDPFLTEMNITFRHSSVIGGLCLAGDGPDW